MASWVVLEDQTVWIASRVSSFTVVCERCAESGGLEAYTAAAVHGNLPLDVFRGSVECPRGHHLRIEREGR